MKKEEIESLSKTIEKLNKKLVYNYMAIGAGVLLVLLAIIYYMSYPEALGGVISILIVGIVVIVINYINLKQRRKRVEELSIDLKKVKEFYLNQDSE